MPEGTVKWFNAEKASDDLGAPEIVAGQADFDLVTAFPHVLGDSLVGGGLVGAAVALGLGAALRTASLRRETGRAGRWSWRVALAGAAMAMAAVTGTLTVAADQTNVALAALELSSDRGVLGLVD